MFFPSIPLGPNRSFEASIFDSLVRDERLSLQHQVGRNCDSVPLLEELQKTIWDAKPRDIIVSAMAPNVSWGLAEFGPNRDGEWKSVDDVLDKLVKIRANKRNITRGGTDTESEQEILCLHFINVRQTESVL